MLFVPHLTRRGYVIELTCSHHAENMQQSGIPGYSHIPQIGRLASLLTRNIVSPCRLHADAQIYQKWRLFGEGPEPSFPVDHLLKYSVREFLTFGGQPTAVRRLCEQAVFSLSDVASYAECVKRLASQLPRLPEGVVAMETVARRSARVAQLGETTTHMRTRSSDRSFTRRAQRLRPVGRTGAAPRKVTIEHEENASRHVNQAQTISSERFWKIIDQSYFKSLPQVADCVPNRVAEGVASVSGLTPVTRAHETRSLFQYQSPLPMMQSMPAMNSDRLTNRDVRCALWRVLTGRVLIVARHLADITFHIEENTKPIVNGPLTSFIPAPVNSSWTGGDAETDSVADSINDQRSFKAFDRRTQHLPLQRKTLPSKIRVSIKQLRVLPHIAARLDVNMFPIHFEVVRLSVFPLRWRNL